MNNLELYILDYAPALCGVCFVVAALIISETGKIFYGSIIYLIADLIYIIFAWVRGDWLGWVTLLLGLIFGIRTLMKMHYGIFTKKLKLEEVPEMVNELN